MFVRVWMKAENVGHGGCVVQEHYVAIQSILRFYSRTALKGDIRYIVVTSATADTFYVTQETFEYLKSLRHKDMESPYPPSGRKKFL